MSLYERFAETKEEGFREEFIKPLLIRMGFMGISNKHGVNEFGKDYVFSELERFGFFRHLIVQAKHEEKLNQGKKVDDLVSQIKQCFYVPYTLPTAPTEQRYVSAVYVFNSGDITDNAETQIRHSLPKEIASNVRCFSGHHLEILGRVVAQRQGEELRMRLLGLGVQLEMNVEIWEGLFKTTVQSPDNPSWDARGGILHSLEEYLTSPFLPDRIPYTDIQVLWDSVQIVRTMIAKYAVGGRGNVHREADLKFLDSVLTRGIATAKRVNAAILGIVESLPPPVI